MITDDIELIPGEEEGELPDLQKKIKKLREDLRKCGDEKKEYLDGWQRAKADFINYRNEEGRRMEDMARFVTTGLIQDILPVLDSFELALGHSLGHGVSKSEDIERGILLIRSQFGDILKRRGLEQIKVEIGEKFDPEKHESIGEVESEKEEGTIAEEVQKGYILRGRVLRPTRVRLAKSLINHK